MLREVDIEDYLKQQVEARGGWARKHKTPGRRGALDRLIVRPLDKSGNPQLPIFTEVKTPDGVLSTLQKREIKRLQELGMLVEVVWSKADVDALVAKYF